MRDRRRSSRQFLLPAALTSSSLGCQNWLTPAKAYAGGEHLYGKPVTSLNKRIAILLPAAPPPAGSSARKISGSPWQRRQPRQTRILELE